jgi:hypothetical protein
MHGGRAQVGPMLSELAPALQDKVANVLAADAVITAAAGGGGEGSVSGALSPALGRSLSPALPAKVSVWCRYRCRRRARARRGPAPRPPTAGWTSLSAELPFTGIFKP